MSDQNQKPQAKKNILTYLVATIILILIVIFVFIYLQRDYKKEFSSFENKRTSSSNELIDKWRRSDRGKIKIEDDFELAKFIYQSDRELSSKVEMLDCTKLDKVSVEDCKLYQDLYSRFNNAKINNKDLSSLDFNSKKDVLDFNLSLKSQLTTNNNNINYDAQIVSPLYIYSVKILNK
jgi:hypothetical protein